MNHAANVMYLNTGEGDIVQLSAIQTDLYDYPSLSTMGYSGSLKNPVRLKLCQFSSREKIK